MSNYLVNRYHTSRTLPDADFSGLLAHRAGSADSLTCQACGRDVPSGDTRTVAGRPICPACYEDMGHALDAATLASQHEPPQFGGIGASLWDMFKDTHRPTD